MDFQGRHFDYSTLEDGIPDSVRYHVNPEFPVRTDSLRILAIGNSFTDDAMQYMDENGQLMKNSDGVVRVIRTWNEDGSLASEEGKEE